MNIFEACKIENIEFIQNYINSGNNINITNEDNKTPLQYLNDENKKIINHFITALKFKKIAIDKL